MKRFSWFAATLSLAIGAASVHANLLDDGSFEAQDLGGNGTTTTSSSNWVLTANSPNGADFAANFATAPWARSPDDGGNVGIWFKAFPGTAGNEANGSVAQDVSAPSSGSYVLTFQAARETFFTADSATASLSSSGTGGSASIDLLTASFNSGGNMNDTANGNPTNFSLTLPGVTAGDTLSVSVDMAGGIDAGSNPQSLMVDNFTLTFIPEPTSIALGGLGLIGLLAARRRR